MNQQGRVANNIKGGEGNREMQGKIRGRLYGTYTKVEGADKNRAHMNMLFTFNKQ